MKRVYVKYKLIFDDILRALQRDHQLRGKKKQVIQSVAFGVLAVGFFVSYLLSRDYKLGLILGILCLGIVAVIWEICLLYTSCSTSSPRFLWICSTKLRMPPS